MALQKKCSCTVALLFQRYAGKSRGCLVIGLERSICMKAFVMCRACRQLSRLSTPVSAVCAVSQRPLDRGGSLASDLAISCGRDHLIGANSLPLIVEERLPWLDFSTLTRRKHWWAKDASLPHGLSLHRVSIVMSRDEHILQRICVVLGLEKALRLMLGFAASGGPFASALLGCLLLCKAKLPKSTSRVSLRISGTCGGNSKQCFLLQPWI